MRNQALVERITYRTARFVRVGAIAIFAIGAVLEYLREEMADFLTLELQCAESFDTGGIYYICTVGCIGHFEHFRESSGVHTGVMGDGYSCCGDFNWNEVL